MQEIDQRDRELLNALQGEIPLVSTPFAFLGQSLDMSEKDVIKRTERLKRQGLVRQISAHFETRALGYRSCLVATRVSPDRIDEAAAVINTHPGVTQNYRRNHDLNLWFTIYVGPHSRVGLEKTIEILGGEAECDAVRPLPTLKLYKSNGAESDAAEHEGSPERRDLTPVEIEAVRLLQHDLPLQPRPFDALARVSGLAADEILAAAREMLRRGQMRKFSASTNTRRSGIAATAMGVWVVPPDALETKVPRFVQHRAVSHCYLRPVYEDWPYNVFTTVHGRSVDECESILNDLAIDTGLEQKQALFPITEYRKVRPLFFAPEAEEWEELHGATRTAAAG